MPNKQKSALIGALCAFAMIVTLGLSFILSSNLFQDGKSTLVLPSDTEQQGMIDEQTEDFAQQNESKIAQITVDPSNVQAVIALLSRPSSYSCSVTNTLYWDGGAGTLQCRQYARDGAYRVETLNGDGVITQVQLQYDGKIYAWDAGSSTYYSGQAGSFSPGEAAMLPTYETVCELPADQIQEAELTELSGQPMIRVTAVQDGRTAEYIVSAVTGLLYSASFSQEGTRTQFIQTSVLSLERPADNLFTLPGQNHTIFVDA